MTTTEWAHLPNAKHIDWVLATLASHPQAWGAARAAAWNAAWSAAWDAARDAARDAAWNAARGAVWDAARDAAWGAARGAARDVAYYAAWGALLALFALIAWDDSRDVLIMPVDAVKLLAACGDHRAVLLLPACHVREELLSLKE
jgi:hypothetical protein